MGVTGSSFVQFVSFSLLQPLGEMITAFSKEMMQEFYKRLYNQVCIERAQTPRLSYAIIEYIKENHDWSTEKYLLLEDGPAKPEPKVVNKTYLLTPQILAQISEENILAYSISLPTKVILEKILEIDSKYNSPLHVMAFYFVSNCAWSNPIYRTPRDYTKIALSEPMRKIDEDMQTFVSAGDDYDKKGIPYRRGYYLLGKPGTGKSLMAELIAFKYSMSIYMFSLNSNKLDDSSLIKLVSEIPPRSLIVFDEIDKQFEAVKNNQTVNVTAAGLLTAWDGPQRLGRGNVLLLTGNERALDESFLRPGRIDLVVDF